MAESFSRLPPSERIAALKSIIASLSPFETSIAKRELLLNDGAVEFDLIACLPSELVHYIFGLLDPRSLIECFKVSKIWRCFASAENVVHMVVGTAGFNSSLPAAANDDCNASDYSILRHLNEREERWSEGRPVLSKAISIVGSVTALALSKGWVAASIGRRLRAWKFCRTEVCLAFDVWTHAAKSIAICPSGVHLAYSSYLRTATVYALADSSELFSITSPVESIVSVDLYLDLLAVLKRNGSIDVYNWKQRRQISSIRPNDPKICSMKICSRDWLTAASRDWSTHVFRVKNGSHVYTATLDSINPQLPRNHEPSLKSIERRPGLIVISLFSKVKQVCFVISIARQRVLNLKTKTHPLDTILDVYFERVLFLRHCDGNPQARRILHVTGNGVPNEILVPRPNALLESHTQRAQILSSLPIAALDDDTVLIADNDEKILLVQKFSH